MSWSPSPTKIRYRLFDKLLFKTHTNKKEADQPLFNIMKLLSRINDCGEFGSNKRCAADKTAVNIYL